MSGGTSVASSYYDKEPVIKASQKKSIKLNLNVIVNKTQVFNKRKTSFNRSPSTPYSKGSLGGRLGAPLMDAKSKRKTIHRLETNEVNILEGTPKEQNDWNANN